MNTTAKRTRRSRRARSSSSTQPFKPRSAICRRPGCARPVTHHDQGFCSGPCRIIERQRERSQRLYEALGDTGLTAGLLARAEAMASAWSEYQVLDDELHDAAISVGITDETWRAIKDGSQEATAAQDTPGTAPATR